jgi:hypothetical protein
MRMKFDMHGERGVGTSAASDTQATSSPFSDDRFRSSYRPSAGQQDEDLGGLYDPFARRSNRGSSREPFSTRSRGDQIPCDRPTDGHRSRYVTEHDGDDPWSEMPSSGDFVKSKMEGDFFGSVEPTTTTIPLDEFVRSKMTSDCFVSPEVVMKDGGFDPYFGCDQGGGFPFRGEDHLFKRTGPGQARKSADRYEPAPNSPFADTNFVEEVFVSASVFSNGQRSGQNRSPSPFRTVMTEGDYQVKAPPRKRSSPHKHLVQEASEMWRPGSSKLRP